MAEMPDVITGETITSEWGNDIRDRTIQRYANVADRTASHPSPIPGDLAYMEDTGTIFVYHAGAWTTPLAANEIDGSTEVAAPVSLGLSLTTTATVTLPIPTGWASWKCEATATAALTTSAAGIGARITIDGTDQAQLSMSESGPFAVGGRRTSITTTGSRAITLRGVRSSGTATFSTIYLYARAVRTS